MSIINELILPLNIIYAQLGQLLYNISPTGWISMYRGGLKMGQSFVTKEKQIYSPCWVFDLSPKKRKNK